jgi:hypothetical protein
MKKVAEILAKKDEEIDIVSCVLHGYLTKYAHIIWSLSAGSVGGAMFGDHRKKPPVKSSTWPNSK